MKIGIMGAHGTGKTTLAYSLAWEHKRRNPEKKVGLVTEVVRQCPFPVNLETSREAQRWIYHQQMIREIEEYTRNDILVCDRTILDNLAYSEKARFGDVLNDYFNSAIFWMNTYDHIYFLHPEEQIADDGFREVDREFQQEIDRILSSWVKTYEIPVEESEKVIV